MKGSLLGSGFLMIVFALGSGCSEDRTATNTNAGNNANTGVTSNNAVSANANVATEKREYPAEVAEEFVKSCEESGSPREYCTCMFEKVQEEYTFEEFSTIETKISAGEPPDEFVEFTGKARTACTK